MHTELEHLCFSFQELEFTLVCSTWNPKSRELYHQQAFCQAMPVRHHKSPSRRKILISERFFFLVGQCLIPFPRLVFLDSLATLSSFLLRPLQIGLLHLALYASM